MKVRTFALILGIVYTIVGLLGFLPGVLKPPAGNMPDMTMTTGYGLLFGIFPVNLLHGLVHLIIGIWGIIAYRAYAASKTYAKVVGVLFILLAIMGLIPGLNTLFGLVPLYGHDIWLHGLTGLLGLYFGFVASDERIATSGTAAR